MPLPRYTLETLASRHAWGPPASTTGSEVAYVSRWADAGDGTWSAEARWHGPRPGVLDAVAWARP